MKARVVVAEMDPSRIDVACRAVTHDLIPSFQARAGADCAYWFVHRISGEVLTLTTCADEEALTALLDTEGGSLARVASRTGLVIRSIRNMDVVEADDPGLTSTALARWARVAWTVVVAGDADSGPGRKAAQTAGKRLDRASCGVYQLNDTASDTRLAVTLWDRPPSRSDESSYDPAHERRPTLEVRSKVRRVVELHGLGVIGRTRTP